MDISEYRKLTFPFLQDGDLARANGIHSQQTVYVDDEQQGYDFIEELEAAFPGVTHNQHGFVVPWSNKSTRIGAASMKMVQDALAAQGLAAVPYYGTLLGMTRDNDLIPWDDDVDMMIVNREPRPMRESVYYVNDQILQAVTSTVPDTDRYPTGKERLFTHVPIRHMLEGQVNKIDLFLPVLSGDQTAVWIPGDKHRPVTFDFTSTATAQLHGYDFTAPADVGGLLSFLYGDDWETPIKCHRFRTGLVVADPKPAVHT